MGADQQLSSYERMLELTERELELVRSGELAELPALQDERRALADSLPTEPPAAARPALERAAQLQAEATLALAHGMREITAELGRLDSGRSTVRRYGVPAPPAPKRVDHAA